MKLIAYFSVCYPRIPIGKVWIYRSLFVCLFVCLCLLVCVCVCVCTVKDFSVEDKASGVKFFKAVHRRPRQGIAHFCELCSTKSSKSDESASTRATPTRI